MKVLVPRQDGAKVDQMVLALPLRQPLAQSRWRNGVFGRSAAYPKAHGHQRFLHPATPATTLASTPTCGPMGGC